MAMYPSPFDTLFVHDVSAVGEHRGNLTAQPLTELKASGARTVLVAAFDAARTVARIAHMVPPGATVLTLDDARLPDDLLTSRSRYLDKLNFATNFAFFRDADGLHTRLVSANYWANYGAAQVRLWLRLFDADGAILATWEQALPPGPGGFSIDSSVVRDRFGLAPFTGQLFIHCPAPMTPTPGLRTATLACPRHGRMKKWCCGCRTAMPFRSRPELLRWIAWDRRARSP